MSTIKLPFLSAAAALLTATAWAATPVAVWDGDFSSSNLTQTGTDGNTYTLNLNSNSPSTDNASVTVASGTTGLNFNITDSSGTAVQLSNGMTVIVEFSGYANTSTNMSLITFYANSQTSQYKNLVGVVGLSDNKLAQLWGARTYYPTAAGNTATLGSGDMKLGYAWAANSTEGWWTLVSGDTTYNYQVGTFKSSGAESKPTGAYIGGLDTSTSVFSGTYTGFDDKGPASVAMGLVIKKIAVFNSKVTQADIAAYKFPSEITEYTATGVNGTLNWSDIEFDNTWASSDASTANITLAGDATITLPTDFQAHTINFTGDYAVMLISSGTELATIGTITGGSSITRVIPAAATAAITVPAGQIYTLAGTTEEGVSNTYVQVFTVNGTLALTGNLALTGANKITGTDSKIEVKDGTTYLATSTCGITTGGKVVIDEGATLVSLTTDAGDYNNSDWSVEVYGTLDLVSTRWTFKGGQLNLYGDAIVKGDGDTNGAVDFWSRISMFSATGANNQARIQAPIKWTSGDAVI